MNEEIHFFTDNEIPEILNAFSSSIDSAPELSFATTFFFPHLCFFPSPAATPTPPYRHTNTARLMCVRVSVSVWYLVAPPALLLPWLWVDPLCAGQQT